MTKIKKFLTAVCTAGLLFSLSATGVSAEEYTYTVTFDAGNQASMGGSEGLAVNNSATGSSYQVNLEGGKIVVSGLKAQDIVTFHPQSGAVQLQNESKYYIKGVRRSGRDNNSVASSSFRVTGDADYVVAYGIKGNMVGYTVNYQDTDGRTLAESRQYYGNVGDKPVVAHIYIENYVPQALALTKTLSSNEAENVFTFVYEKEETQVEVVTRPGETVTETITENVTQNSGSGNGGTSAQTDNNGNGAADDQTADQNGSQTAGEAAEASGDTGNTEAETQTSGGGADAGDSGTAGGDAIPAGESGNVTDIQEEEVPQADSDVVDLDEEETPLGSIDIDKKKVEKGFPVAAGIAIAVAAAAGLGVLIWFLRKHKKA